MDKKKAREILKKENVHFLRLQFTDIFGIYKNVEVPQSQFDKALNGDILFDGSSIDGFTRIEESDMILKPDFRSFRIFPWQIDNNKIARIICDAYIPDGTPFIGCPRYTLKKMCEKAKKMGFEMLVGPEAEFFLFKREADGRPSLETHDEAGYFDMAPVDEGEIARQEMVNILQGLEFEVEAAHHEVAHGQHEIAFRYEEALKAADNIVTFKFIVKKIAKKYGLHATFMPKPIFGMNGSGMHCHQSLFKGTKNVFYDREAEYELSKICLYYIGGVLKHAKAICAVTNPLVNSYKRLVPGYEAPVNIAWSEKNRSPLVRVPARREKGTRIEFRLPDPACNPYLGITVMLAAGLDGIKNKIMPPPPVNKNIFTMSEREKRRLKIDQMPANLSEALYYLKKDNVLKEALGPLVFDHYVNSKQAEWDNYISKVTNWEVEKYFEIY